MRLQKLICIFFGGFVHFAVYDLWNSLLFNKLYNKQYGFLAKIRGKIFKFQKFEHFLEHLIFKVFLKFEHFCPILAF
jgi:hypothetical protein